MSKRTLQVVALVAVAFNLRLAMSCIGPIVEYLRNDLQMSRAAIGLLSTLPVLCMGVFAPLAQRISAARGHETAILFAIIVIACSACLRSFANPVVLLVSALIAGAGIAVAGTLLNAFVKEHFADRAVSVSGMYSASLCLGAALAAGLTAPLTQWTGSWRFALAVWSVPGFVASLLWWRMRSTTIDDRSRHHSAVVPAARSSNHPPVWLLTVFFGLQSITFYVVLAWLAPRYVELGWKSTEAGALLGYWIAVQVVSILLISRLASRSRDRRPWLVACGVAAFVAMFGFAFAPTTSTWLWIALLGFACGGWFPLAMTLPLDYSNTPSDAGRLTAIMLCGGYLLSAGSPSLAGALRDSGITYREIFAAMAVLSALLAVMAMWLKPPAQ